MYNNHTLLRDLHRFGPKVARGRRAVLRLNATLLLSRYLKPIRECSGLVLKTLTAQMLEKLYCLSLQSPAG